MNIEALSLRPFVSSEVETPLPRRLSTSLEANGRGFARGSGLFAALTLLGGCASIPSIYEQPGDSTFGEANRQTMMAQVVNPDPVYEEPMTTSGDHAADAIDRYRNDAVVEPERVSTTSGASGGGG